MKYSRVYLALCSTLLASQVSLAVAHADQGSGESFQSKKTAEAKLDEMVITATRVEESKLDIPATVQVISQEDIKNSSAKDAGDLMVEAGIGHVHKYNGALTGTTEIRGLSTDLFTESSSRVLLLVNGNQAGTTNLAKIPTSEIERIEIVKGPGSVLYGSQAMGGVINIITKRGKEGFHGSVGAEGGSWGYWKTLADVGGKYGNLDYFVTGAISSIDDYHTKKGRYRNTGNSVEEFSSRFGYTFLKDHRVSVGFQHWKGWDIGSPNATYSPDYDDYMIKERNAFDLDYTNKYTTFKYYLNNNIDNWYTGNNASSPTFSRFTANNHNQGLSLQQLIPIGSHRIIVGGQWDRKAVDTSSSGGAPYYPDSSYDNYAIFTEGKLNLLKDTLIMTAGVRYDYFDNNTFATPGITVSPISKGLDHVTARGGIVYKLFKDFSLKGSVGTAFRAPSPMELASNYNPGWGSTIGNPNLAPEKSISYEAGFEYARKFAKGSFAFFHTDFTDRITSYYNAGLGATTYKNLPGATIQGLEFSGSYDAGLAHGLGVSVEPFFNVTYKTRYDSGDPSVMTTSGGRLFYIPEWTGAFGVSMGQEKWDGKVIVNYTGDEYITDYSVAYPYRTVKKGGFMVVNLKGAYRPIKNLEVTASVSNLFDKGYGYINGYDMPGRTFIGGLKWMF